MWKLLQVCRFECDGDKYIPHQSDYWLIEPRFVYGFVWLFVRDGTVECRTGFGVHTREMPWAQMPKAHERSVHSGSCWKYAWLRQLSADGRSRGSNASISDSRSLAYSHSGGHRSRGSRCWRCGKVSRDMDRPPGHWAADGRPVNLRLCDGKIRMRY